jgi:hypothetical protein
MKFLAMVFVFAAMAFGQATDTTTVQSEKVIAPAVWDSVMQAVHTSIKDTTTVKQKVWTRIRQRQVKSIDYKFNPNIVTQNGDTLTSIFILRRNGKNTLLQKGTFVPVADRLIVMYVTSAEK